MQLKRTKHSFSMKKSHIVVALGVLAIGAVTFAIFFRSEPLINNSYTFDASRKMEIVAAGVPKYLGETRDYQRIFTELEDAGFTAFLATTQYQEHPVALSLETEIDFYPPCNPEDSQWKALRDAGIKLVVPAELVFSAFMDERTAGDPLAEIIACAGRENILGVTNYDEPAGRMWDSSITERSLKDYYNRVKRVDSTLPVLMVHAPLFASRMVEGYDEPFPVKEDRDRFFDLTKSASTYADIVGFDIYPVPVDFMGGLTSPLREGKATESHTDVIEEYLSWQREMLPSKELLYVMQGFDYRMQFASSSLDELVEQKDREIMRAPTDEEFRDMVDAALAGGVRTLIWWGQSHITESDAGLWGDIKEAATYAKSKEGVQ